MNACRIAAKIIKKVTWFLNDDKDSIYLTFDDGPTSSVTPWILEMLDQYNARATFFCLGCRVEQFPLQYEEILRMGHAIGNHTYSHLNGFFSRKEDYIQDIDEASRMICSDLFRPPYGSIRPSQIRRLHNGFRIIMWDVLSRDYDPGQTPQNILDRLKRKVQPGSIVVFHDSCKAEKNMKGVLISFLQHFSSKGYIFKAFS